jgi:hypothetical protein
MAKENSAVKLEIDPDMNAALAESTQPEPRPIKRSIRGRPDLNFVRQTFLIPRATNEIFNKLARDDSTTVQSLLEEMAEMYMRHRGVPQSFFPPDWGGWEFEKAKDKEKQRKKERSQ